jgi:hypothetical protein
MASQYVLQIVDKDTGELAATWAPGAPAEAEFIDTLCQRVAAHLGEGRTTNGVLDALAETWTPGSPTEAAFVDTLCQRIAESGVGIGRTTAHVLTDVRASFEAQVRELKRRVRPPQP